MIICTCMSFAFITHFIQKHLFSSALILCSLLFSVGWILYILFSFILVSSYRNKHTNEKKYNNQNKPTKLILLRDTGDFSFGCGLFIIFFYHNLRKRKGSLCLSEQCICVVSLKAVQDSTMREGEAHGKYGYNLHVAMSHYSYLFFPPDICVSFQLSLTYPLGRVFRRMDFTCLFLCTL